MSFRERLFATYAMVIVICLAIVGIAAAAVLPNYRDRIAMDRLDNMARPISVEVRSLVIAQTPLDTVFASLATQAEKNNVYIMLINKDGSVLRQITPGSSQPLNVTSGLPRNVSNAIQGSFRTSNGRAFIYAAYPLERLQAALANPSAAVLLAVPRPSTLAILSGFVIPLLIGGVAALLISLLLAVLFARSISRPLNRVTEAAKQMAEGDYRQVVPEQGTREMVGMARSFNRMAEEVRQSQQQLRHFVADVSHELKSPLTSIQGFSQALIDGTAGDDQTRSRAASVINAEARRMRRQVDELLELSRMQSGQFKMAHDSIDLAEVIERCQEIFEGVARDKGVQISATVEGPLPMIGDADHLEQLFTNLLDNAIKNTHSGGQVRIYARAAADGFAETNVSDDGPGIPSDQLPHVFERFYQVTGVRTGVGLGLAIAREIALAHQGSIEARSQPGEGSQFIVRLPPGRPADE